MATVSKEQIIHSSGNVFADLGLPDAEMLNTKVRLAVALNRIFKDRRLSEAEAAAALSISAPRVSALMNYKLDKFAIVRLMRFLLALGQDVETLGMGGPRLARKLTLDGRIDLRARRHERTAISGSKDYVQDHSA